jgi:hypothetical protein
MKGCDADQKILNGQGKEQDFEPSHARVDPFNKPSLGRDSMGETQALDLMNPVP